MKKKCLYDEEVFWQHVGPADPVTGCRLWLKARDKDGYGSLVRQGPGSRKMRATHRALELDGRPLTDGQIARHKCDNPPCVEPTHIVPGSYLQNGQDKKERGRAAAGERHGRTTKPECTARGERHGAKTHPEAIRRGDNHPLRIDPSRAARGDRNGARLHPETRSRGSAHSEIMFRVAAKGERHGSKTHPEKVCRGSKHGNSKCSDNVVRTIRGLHAAGVAGASKLSRYFGLTPSAVSKIVLRQTYPHVSERTGETA